MIRAVLDANVVVSSMVRFRDGDRAPAVVLRAWVAGAFELVISDHLLAEIERTLHRPYFTERVDNQLIRDTLDAMARQATHVDLVERVSGVASHPEDDLVLATVISGDAAYLVTGDRQLLRLGGFQGAHIVDADTFRRALNL